MSPVQIFHPCLLLSSSTGYQTFKHGFQISNHVRACRHVKIGPAVEGQGGIKRYRDPSVCLSVCLSQGAAALGAQLP